MSSSTTEALGVLKDPTGWSSQPAFLLKDYYWVGKDSIKGMLENEYDIPVVDPVITRFREVGGDIMFLFKSSPKGKPVTYYVWNGSGNIVCRIDGQKDLNGIYSAISARGGYLGGLNMVRIYASG